MEFISTRGLSKAKNASEAIAAGIAADGGLFVPEYFPDMTEKFADLLGMDYADRAAEILHAFLGEYDKEKLKEACRISYGKFDDGDAAPLVKIDDDLYILELFHGPTLAFKDIALTLLPYLLRTGCDNAGIKEDILILVATSGDTGKAALEGFKNQKGVKVMVFYPDDGVSDMQKLQMCTTEGNNVNVVAVKGNFDDCQTAVKKMFNDPELKKELKAQNVIFSSANSMNFGRLCPQIVYYFSSYLDMVGAGEIKMGDKVNFVVPTGNFGNILAGWYAYKMGLPVGKLICASNKNNVLTDFFQSGEYDADREFYKTASPSMDILISSNLERLIFEISGRNAEKTAGYMAELKEKGGYKIDANELALLKEKFYAAFSGEEETENVIGNFFDEYDYVLDTHTAVAMGVYDNYVCDNEGDDAPAVVLSTASPYKFPVAVYKALAGKEVADPIKACGKIESLSAVPVPEQISSLTTLPVRFDLSVEKNELETSVKQFASK